MSSQPTLFAMMKPITNNQTQTQTHTQTTTNNTPTMTALTPNSSHLNSSVTRTDSISHKRSYDEMKEPTTIPMNTTPTNESTPSHGDRIQVLRQYFEHHPQHSWSTTAIQFAEHHLNKREDTSIDQFIALIRLIVEATTNNVTTTTQPQPSPTCTNTCTPNKSISIDTIPILPPIKQSIINQLEETTPNQPPAPTAPVTTAPAPAAATVQSTESTFQPPSDVLFTIADVSLLVPRGKFTLLITPRLLLLTNPTKPANNLSIQWQDVEFVLDVSDINKRDWLIGLHLKKERGLVVGKKLEHAIILKFLEADKVKAGRISVNKASTADATMLQSIQTICQSSTFIGSKLRTTVLTLLRSIPLLSSLSVIGYEPHIYDSLKKLPCVSCKYGVEDGALYFLRTGLMFIKPVQYIPIHMIDGITPARGASSTFDMRIGVVGSKQEIEFKMIEPKEEGAITKYCMYLGKEQARIEKEEKARKMGLTIPTVTLNSTVTPTASAAAAASISTTSTTTDSVDSLTPEATSSHGEMGLSITNIVNAPRSSRAARPKSFQHLSSESEDEEREETIDSKDAPMIKSEPTDPSSGQLVDGDDESVSDGNDDGDSDSVRSSEDDDWSSGSMSDSSEDSAEYDSEKDGEEINSEDERERESKRRKTMNDDDESEDDHDHTERETMEE